MADRRVTLKTIAEEVGVSRTTVSNAYNRPDQLNPALRERILGAARRLGYAGPDPAARRLRSGRRGAIGLLFTERLSYAFTDPGAVQFLVGLTQATDAADLALLILPSLKAKEVDASPVHEAVVDALCAYSMPDGCADLDAAQARRLPLVLVDGPRLEGHSFVGIDDREGGRLAAAHLARLGHRRVGVLTDAVLERGQGGRLAPGGDAAMAFLPGRDRLAGYRDGLGLDWDALPKWDCGGNDRARGAAATRALLAADPGTTALLCLTDMIALGALDAARELGLAVPAELSVVGFDDVPEATGAGLTTVHQPLVEKGVAAGRLLVTPPPADAPADVVLPVELVTRASAGPPRG